VDPGPTPGLVEVDASLLEHAVVNLVVNARDAMPDGGLIRITAGVPSPDERAPEGGWVAIRVSDTGPGIPPEVAEHMFEPFFSTKPAGRGTGLGLAMVHGFVEQSGGRLRVRTQPDTGTTFTILLPVSSAIAVDRVPAEAPVPAMGIVHVDGRGTVLVAEDEAVLRAIAERALRKAGYTVLLADSGEQAVRMATDHAASIDLLFTDIVMPGIHGIALAKSMRATRPGIRVLITSGYTQDDVVRRGVDMGETPFLAKPYTPSGLVAAVEAALA
jgi:CheY-like chemotaxis protein/anti-sigma regulatory factor (Ser/Thr protein kinase)